MMPGKKDCVTMKIGGEQIKVQKKQILFTVYDTYLQFKELNPNIKVGFSKFAEHRPKNVVLPGASATHVVCLCTYHQNPKLMIANSKINTKAEFKKLVELDGNGKEFTQEIKYHHLLPHLMCKPAKQECWLNECDDCPKPSLLAEKLEKTFTDIDVESVTYKQWESTDRTELVTHTHTVSEFVEILVEKLLVLKKHQFTNTQQVEYFKQTKENLLPGEVLAFGDFSQNYAFVYQDAAQGVHWNNSSCTLHPWISYYRGQDGTLKTFSLLIISDCLKHETVQVYSFQKILIEHLKLKLEEEGFALNKIEYGTDGCAKQYKNKKNLSNLAHHQQDFGMKAKWTFQATSHGKGPWDGLAGRLENAH